MKNRIIKCISALMLACSFPVMPVQAEEKTADAAEITILYTNDVHCAIDGYAPFGGYKAQLESEGKNVLAVDSGDCTQGELIGVYSQGEAVIELMNHVPYDVSVPGNHEFDYHIMQLLVNEKIANQPFLCCNFKDLVKDELVFEEYLIKEIDGYQVGFVGVITPSTYTATSPKSFKDDNGNFIYSFCETNFYETIQTAVDHARDAGAEIVIAIGHVGIDGREEGQRSTDIIENTRGIDAFIDGHTHEVIEGPDYKGTEYKNLDGKTVPITSTGTKFEYFGEMTISLSGHGDSLSETITTRLIKTDKAVITDESALAREKEIQNLIDEKHELVRAAGEEVVGVSEVTMPAHFPGSSEWKVRAEESSLGDFMADAIRWKTGADIGVYNGGGCRADINEGTVTAADIINSVPWIQQVGLIEAAGQQILNSLEVSVINLPDASGWFLQVSGITFEADPSIETPVVLTERGTVDHVGEGKRRISNVKIGGEPLDPDRIYTIGSTIYVAQEGGAGQSELSDCTLLSSDYPTDTEIMVEYVKEALNGKITKEQYGNPDGDGRIIILNQEEMAEASAQEAAGPAVSEPAPHHSGELSIWGKIIVAIAGIIGIWLLVRDPKKK